MGHANEDLLRRGYEAFWKQDMAALRSLFTEDLQWHSKGESPFAGDFKGQQEVFTMFGSIGELTDVFEQELHEILANDEHGVVMVDTHVERAGRSADLQQIHIYHFADGKVSEAFIVDVDPAKTAAFWAD